MYGSRGVRVLTVRRIYPGEGLGGALEVFLCGYVYAARTKCHTANWSRSA